MLEAEPAYLLRHPAFVEKRLTEYVLMVRANLGWRFSSLGGLVEQQAI